MNKPMVSEEQSQLVNSMMKDIAAKCDNQELTVMLCLAGLIIGNVESRMPMNCKSVPMQYVGKYLEVLRMAQLTEHSMDMSKPDYKNKML